MISGPSSSVELVPGGTDVTLSASASDSDLPAQALSYSLDAGSLALGMTIDANSGAFSWTPGEDQGGLTPIVTVTVSDGTTTDSQSFTITVNELNDAPVLAPIANQSVDEGATLSFSASATDADLPAELRDRGLVVTDLTRFDWHRWRDHHIRRADERHEVRSRKIRKGLLEVAWYAVGPSELFDPSLQGRRVVVPVVIRGCASVHEKATVEFPEDSRSHPDMVWVQMRDDQGVDR